MRLPSYSVKFSIPDYPLQQIVVDVLRVLESHRVGRRGLFVRRRRQRSWAVLHLADPAGQVVLPTPEQIPRELAQLTELAVRGALCRLELLGLDEEALLLERPLQLFSFQRFARLPLAACIRMLLL